MIFGYSTNAFVKYSLAEAIKKIVGLGFRGVEIMCDIPHLYPDHFGEKDLADLKKIISGYNLKITNLNSFTLFAVGNTYLPSWIDPKSGEREIRINHTLNCLKIADYLGCHNISVPPGGPKDRASRKQSMRLFYGGLERVIPLAEELGVKVLVEPEPDLLIENTREFKSFVKNVQSKYVGINFDIGHFFCAGEDPAVAFEELFQWVGHIHLEDIAQSRIHNHLIAGHGVIRFPEVFKTMKRLDYQGDISLELYPYVDTPEEAGRKSIDFLRPIFLEAGLEVLLT